MPLPELDKKFKRVHIRHCILHLYHCGMNATKACKILQETYGDKVVCIETCQRWFRKFTEEGFDLSNKPLAPNRGIKVRSEDVEALYFENPSMTSREIGKQLGVNCSTISRRLAALGHRLQKKRKRKHEDDSDSD